MREEEKTFTACLALFDSFSTLNRTHPMYTVLPNLAAVGVVAAGAATLVKEVVADLDVMAEAAAEAQAKADPQTNLRSTTSLGFRPTSTTP